MISITFNKLAHIIFPVYVFLQINTPDKYWTWMDEILMPNLYSGPHYNGSELNWREQLQIDDRATIRLGVARIRQQRIKEGEKIITNSVLNRPAYFPLIFLTQNFAH